MRVYGDDLDVLELVLEILHVIFPSRLAVLLRVAGDERKLEGFALGETSRGVTGQRPDDIDDTVLDLVVQLRRRAAELHRGIELDFDLAAGFGFDFLRPFGDESLRHRRLRRQGLGNAERHLLRERCGRSSGERKRSGQNRTEAEECGHVGFLPSDGWNEARTSASEW